jgi:hypothetical protein
VPPHTSISALCGAEVSNAGNGYSLKKVVPRLWRDGQTSENLLDERWPFPGRPPKHDLSTWTVTDDWPELVPVTEAEVEVFEAWFGDLFDKLFGPCR